MHLRPHIECSVIAQRLEAMASELTRLAAEIARLGHALADPPPGLSPGLPTASSGTRLYLRARQAAEQLGVTAQTLARWRSTGGGPPYHKVGGRVMYCREDLRSWMEDRRYPHTSAKSARRVPS